MTEPHFTTTARLTLVRLGIDTYREFVVSMNRNGPVCRSEGFVVRSRISVSLFAPVAASRRARGDRFRAERRDQGLMARRRARFGKLDPTSRLKVWCPYSEDLLSCSRLPGGVADRTVLLCSVQGSQPSEVASAVRALIAAKGGEVAVITDEAHHLSHGSTRGATIDAATDGARYRIGLSGTPYRHDDGAILDACPTEGFKPDYHYSKAEALSGS